MILISQPTNPSLSDAWVNDLYDFNPDGVGFMYFDPVKKKTTVRKLIGTKAEVLALYREVEALKVTFVAHFRQTTHGLTNLANCHPYEVAEDTHLVHNGILALGYQGEDPAFSDTFYFIKNQIKPLLEVMTVQQAFSPAMCAIMGAAIGNNRFCAIDSEGTISIVNEQQWHDWEGILLSNTYAISNHKGISPTAGPTSYSHPISFGKWKGNSSMAGMPSYQDEDAYWGMDGYSGSITALQKVANTRLSAKGDVVDDKYIADSIDRDLEAQERELREAEEAEEDKPELTWPEFLDSVEELYGLEAAEAVDFLSTHIAAYYTAKEIDEADLDWHNLAKCLFERDACWLAQMLAAMQEGFDLNNTIEEACLFTHAIPH
jgi:hypothetical protein